MSAFFKPINLRAPGAIDDLLKFHAARFGDARMEEGAEGEDEGGKGSEGGKGKGAGATSEKGFPEGVALEEMTSPQREAYWKDKARKHEERNKAFGNLTPEALKAMQDKASKHDEMERDLMSDKDKAVAEARDAARAEATPRVVRAEFKAAAKGVLSNDQLAALLEDRDLSKYVNADGEPDEDKILKLVTAFAPAKQTRTGPTSRGLGKVGGTPTEAGAQGRAMAERRFGGKK